MVSGNLGEREYDDCGFELAKCFIYNYCGIFPSLSTQNSFNVWFSYAKMPSNFAVDKSGLCRTGWRVPIDEN
jgi:hypothetical protein